MVEVVGTAPTSAMVITKFVYRRSWKTNFINIKGITTDSITIMKLTKEQSEEIKNQQNQNNPTKRVTASELEKILYEAIPALDHGFVRVIDYMGDDTSIVQSARVSYGKGTKQVSTDKGLIKYLMRHWHSTPFEMCEVKYHIKLPIFIARQWIRHRTANVNEYSARYSILDKEFYLPSQDNLAAQSISNRQGRGDVLEGEQAKEVLELLKNDAERTYDDVIDEGIVRRGKETLNKVWDNHSSVLIGDYLLSRCFEMMVEDGNLEVLKLLSSTSSKIAQGEVLQLQHKGEIDMLEETYLKIISAKTADLFAAATKVGAILSDADTKKKNALEFYGKNLGLTFQIADDTLDYNSDLILFGKKVGQDFFEGKITLPTILLFQKLNSDEKRLLVELFKKYTRNNDDFKKVISLIKKYNIIEECHQKARHYINLASNSLIVFQDSKEKEIFKRLTSFSLGRNF